ncbi:hypothetical protein D3C80_1727370 [compost metagenome]
MQCLPGYLYARGFAGKALPVVILAQQAVVVTVDAIGYLQQFGEVAQHGGAACQLLIRQCF